jgi:hypothetical protein
MFDLYVMLETLMQEKDASRHFSKVIQLSLIENLKLRQRG